MKINYKDIKKSKSKKTKCYTQRVLPETNKWLRKNPIDLDKLVEEFRKQESNE